MAELSQSPGARKFRLIWRLSNAKLLENDLRVGMTVIVLIDFEKRGGAAEVSIGYLARHLVIADNTVRSSLKRLEAKGFFRIDWSKGRKPHRVSMGPIIDNPSTLIEGLNPSTLVEGLSETSDGREHANPSASVERLTPQPELKGKKYSEEVVGAGPSAGPLPHPSSDVAHYDLTSATEGSALHRDVPFDDQCDLPLSAESRRTDTGLGPDRPSDLSVDVEEVWNDLWSAWPWIDDEVEARSAFDSALRETSAKKIADAYNRCGTGSGNDFTDMIGAVLASLRRAAA